MLVDDPVFSDAAAAATDDTNAATSTATNINTNRLQSVNEQ